MNRTTLLQILQTTGSLRQTHKDKHAHRTIYEAGDARGKQSGRFFVDYACCPGGSTEEVPYPLICELEVEGLIVRAFPDRNVNAWILASERFSAETEDSK